MLSKQAPDLALHAALALAGQRPPVNQDRATVRDNVGLCPAGNRADVDRRAAEEAVAPPPQLRGVFGFQHIHDSRHRVHRVAPKLRPGAVGGFAAGFQLQPQTAFMGGHHLEAGRLAHHCQIRLETAGGQRPGTSLAVFFVHQTGKNNFRPRRPRSGSSQFTYSRDHDRNRAFGVARPAAIKATIPGAGSELLVGPIDGVQMRRQQNPPANFSGR